MKTYADLIDHVREYIKGMDYDGILPAKGFCYEEELPEMPRKVTAEPGSNEGYYVCVEGDREPLVIIRIHYKPAVVQVLIGCWNAIEEGYNQ